MERRGAGDRETETQKTRWGGMGKRERMWKGEMREKYMRKDEEGGERELIQPQSHSTCNHLQFLGDHWESMTNQ